LVKIHSHRYRAIADSQPDLSIDGSEVDEEEEEEEIVSEEEDDDDEEEDGDEGQRQQHNQNKDSRKNEEQRSAENNERGGQGDDDEGEQPRTRRTRKAKPRMGRRKQEYGSEAQQRVTTDESPAAEDIEKLKEEIDADGNILDSK